MHGLFELGLLMILYLYRSSFDISTIEKYRITLNSFIKYL